PLDVRRKLGLQRLQDLPEVGALVRVHVGLPLLADIRGDGLLQQLQSGFPPKKWSGRLSIEPERQGGGKPKAHFRQPLCAAPAIDRARIPAYNTRPSGCSAAW